MSESLIANLVLGWVCLGWPGLAFLFGLAVGRHGLAGLWRGLLLRLPRPAPRDANYS